MKSIKVLLTLFLIFSLITSCSKDDSKEEIIEEENTEIPVEEEEEEEEEEETAPTAPNSLRSFTIEEYGIIQSFYLHYYDNKLDKLAYVNELDEITYYSFAYNASGKIEETTKYEMNPNATSVDFSDSSNFVNAESTITQTYSQNQRLIEIGTWAYSFNADFQITRIMSIYMLPTTNIFYDANNKIKRTDTYENNNDMAMSQFLEFDNNNNPFYYLFDEFGFIIDKNLGIPLGGLYCISLHNLSKRSRIELDNPKNTPDTHVEYTYNNDGYPVESLYYPNTSTIVERKITYEYY